MRTPVSLLLLCTLAFPACDAARAGSDVAVVERFLDRSPLLECESSLHPTDLPPLEQLVTVDDSSLLALFAPAAEVALLGPDLRRRWSLPLLDHGPTAVQSARSVAVSDSIVYVADVARSAIKRLSIAGDDRGTIHLPFPPQQVAVSGRALFVAPLVLFPNTTSLLYRLRGEDPEPLEIPPLDHPDASWKALSNMVALFPLGDRGVLAAHRFVSPVAYRWRPAGPIERLRTPVPDGEAKKVGRAPPVPLDEDSYQEVPLPVIGGAANPGTGGLLFLTRSGARRAGHSEKAVIETDSLMAYHRSFRLPVNAAHMGVLRSSAALVVVDEQDRWYTCALPEADG